MQRRAKVFKNNRSQAVRLPKEFQFSTDEVFIRKEGEDVILSPRPTDWGSYLDSGPVASDGSPRTNLGTLTVDDGTYDIWALPVENRPAITGDGMNFTQIFNVRRVRRTCNRPASRAPRGTRPAAACPARRRFDLRRDRRFTLRCIRRRRP